MMTTLTKKSIAMNDKGRQMNSLGNSRNGEKNILQLLIAVTVCAFLLFGQVSLAAAADYYAAGDSGTNIASGITTDHACGTDPAGAYTELLSTSIGNMCTSSYRWEITSAGLYSKHYSNAAYAVNTTVTGTSYQVTMRDGGTVGIELFYVDSAGSETLFGNEATISQADGATNNYVVDLSGQSAVVPAGSKLGLRTRAVAVNPSFRMYLGNPDGRTGNVSGHLIVEETAGGGGGGGTSTYYYNGDSNYTSPVTVAGTTTNVARACSTGGNNTIASFGGSVPQVASAGSAWDSCIDNRYRYDSTGPVQVIMADTAYTQNTTITGHPGTIVTTRSAAGFTCSTRLNLGYMLNGNFTSFGSSSNSVTRTDATWFAGSYDLSGVSGTVPAGATAAIEVDITTNTGDCRFAYGSAGSAQASGAFSVDEVASGGGGDTIAPTVTAFGMPASSDSPIPVTTFTATDNTAVTGYMITESATAPLAGAAGWTATAPSSVSASSTGNVTFYAWAKDAAGNVSMSMSATVDVTGGSTGGGLPDIDPAGTYIAAENYSAMGSPNPWEWEVQSSVSGYSDTGYLYTISGGTGAATNGSRTDYPVNFTTGGTYCIWIRAMDASGSGGGDSTFWGFDNSYVGAITQSADNVWAWDSDTQNGSNCATISAGNHVLNLWPRETGQKTDAFVIAMVDANADPSGGGLFTGDNDQSTVIPSGITIIDPSDASTGGGGGGSGYVQIPDGQLINGNPINPEDLYDTDLDPTVRQYRALGGESDGFNGFSVDPKWTVTHIGNDVPSQEPMVTNGTINITGRGQNIWNTRDYFTYLYQGGKTGDFTIDVKVNSLQNTATYAKAGIMIRQSLANNSRHAMALLTPSQAGFYRRVTDGASTLGTRISSVTAPRWLRLKRVGDNFTAYYSSDAITWTQVGNDNISMTGTVNVGLAVSSVNTGTDNTANFDNFMFMPAGVSGMSETWSDTSVAVPGSIATTGWTDQDYALSVRSTGGGVDPETNTFTYSSCVDSTPSIIDIPLGQSVSGSAVSLPALFTHSGNASTFTYMIDGVAVGSPWNSLSAFGPGTSGTVSLRVQGIDPDCGG